MEIPGYVILKMLGRGGMSTVYLAEQESFQREVAVKILPEIVANTENYGERFLREARIAANLSHPNIVPVFDTGSFEGNHYLAMEYMPGGDLQQRMAAGLTLAEGMDVIQDVAIALDYAREKGVVHRDIKPANIMFREDGSCAIVDFGIARELVSDANMTQVGAVVGTPHYMSPEQAAGARDKVDGRSDLYSLGIILFEIITGGVPFTADSSTDIGQKHLKAAIPRLPRELKELQVLVDRALAKKPGDRFQTGNEFALAVAQAREGMPQKQLDSIPHRDVDSDTVIAPSGVASGGTSGSGIRLRSSTRERAHQRARAAANERRWRILTVGALLLAFAAVALNFANISLREERDVGGDTARSATATEPMLITEPQIAEAAIEAALADGESAEEHDSARINLLALDYVEKANKALEEGDLQQAGIYLDLARDLDPQEAWLANMLQRTAQRHQLISAERAAIDSQVQRAQAYIDAGQIYSPPEDNLYHLLAGMDEQVAASAEAVRLRERADQLASEAISELLARGDLDGAAAELAVLRPQAGTDITAPLQAQLQGRRSERKAQRERQRELLASAEEMEQAAGTDVAALVLAIGSYRELLAIAPGHQGAALGIRRCSGKALDEVEQAVEQGRLQAARAGIDSLALMRPPPEGLAALERRLIERESQRNTAEQALGRARESVAQIVAAGPAEPGNADEGLRRANELIRAHKLASTAEEMYADLPGVDTVQRASETEYGRHFEFYLAKDDVKSAQALLHQLELNQLDSAAIAAMIQGMQLAIEEASAVKRKSFHGF